MRTCLCAVQDVLPAGQEWHVLRRRDAGRFGRGVGPLQALGGRPLGVPCQACGAQIIVGVGRKPLAEHDQPDYAATVERLGSLLLVEDY